jgi:hypothetical protein
VHLQALTGGEEVIAAGSDSVEGLSLLGLDTVGAAAVADADVEAIDGALRADLEGLMDARPIFRDAVSPRLSSTPRVHNIPVDESLESVVMMVSWHSLGAPVSLTLISPSLRSIRAGSPLYVNQTGSSYQFFRIEDPEPGIWRMLVRSGKREGGLPWGSHAYTWGAYGTSSLGIRYKIPGKLLGLSALRIATELTGRKMARTIRFTGSANLPRLPVESLLEQHGPALVDVRLPFEPDNPKLNPDLFKLAVLDKRMGDEGEGSIFPTLSRRLHLTRYNSYTDVLKTPISGLHSVQLTLAGTSRKGYRYRRQTRFSVRI